MCFVLIAWKNTVESKRKWEEQKIAMEAEKIRRQKEKEEAHKQAVLEKIRREKGEKQVQRKRVKREESGSEPRVQGLIKEEVPAPVARVEATEAVVQIRTASGALTWKVESLSVLCNGFLMFCLMFCLMCLMYCFSCV